MNRIFSKPTACIDEDENSTMNALERVQKLRRNSILRFSLNLVVMAVVMMALCVRPSAATPPPYAVGLTASVSVMAINTSTTVTAHVIKTADSSDVPDVDVSFGASTGSASPSPVKTGPTGRASTTFTAPSSPGTATVYGTATIGGHDYTGSISFSVIGGEFTDDGNLSLRFFCGTQGDRVGVTTAPAQPSGTTWHWTTSEGLSATEASFHYPVAQITEAAPTTLLRGERNEWVQLTYTLGGVSWTSSKHYGYTVYKPSTLTIVPNEEDNDYTTNEVVFNGVSYYQTKVLYLLLNQFGSAEAMGGVPVNESFGTWSDDTANNWPHADPFDSVTDTYDATFQDGWGNSGGAYAFSPPMVFTGDPPTGSTKVLHAPQTIRAGSSSIGSGCSVRTGTLQYYTDHAGLE